MSDPGEIVTALLVVFVMSGVILTLISELYGILSASLISSFMGAVAPAFVIFLIFIFVVLSLWEAV